MQLCVCKSQRRIVSWQVSHTTSTYATKASHCFAHYKCFTVHTHTHSSHTGLLKSLLQSPQACGKGFVQAARDQLPQLIVAWLDTCVCPGWVAAACSGGGGVILGGGPSSKPLNTAPAAAPQAFTTTLALALSTTARALRVIGALLRPFASPTQLALAAGLKRGGPPLTRIDMARFDSILARLLAPVYSPAGTAPSEAYSASVLGAALNVCTSLGALALHPAIAGSALTQSVLEGVCFTGVMPR